MDTIQQKDAPEVFTIRFTQDSLAQQAQGIYAEWHKENERNKGYAKQKVLEAIIFYQQYLKNTEPDSDKRFDQLLDAVQRIEELLQSGEAVVQAKEPAVKKTTRKATQHKLHSALNL